MLLVCVFGFGGGKFWFLFLVLLRDYGCSDSNIFYKLVLNLVDRGGDVVDEIW